MEDEDFECIAAWQCWQSLEAINAVRMHTCDLDTLFVKLMWRTPRMDHMLVPLMTVSLQEERQL
jgi:hypothetical protein